jgi:hypothetical protein
LRRRAFLLGGAAVALVGAGGLLSIRSRQRRAHADNVHSDEAQTHSAHSQSAPVTEPNPEPLFPPEDWPLLLAVADAIVPREGDLPAASEIDLLPKLESWVRGSAPRLRIYERGWPRFRALLERKGEAGASGPSKRTLIRLHTRYRFADRPPQEAAFFEQLRRDVLRLYYASPAGWASVSYTGPVHRPHPLGAPGA